MVRNLVISRLFQAGHHMASDRNWIPVKNPFLAGAIIALSLQIVATGKDAPHSEKRPNVLMLCINDLNDWVGFLGGHPDAITPHMDALAKRGRNSADCPQIHTSKEYLWSRNSTTQPRPDNNR